MEELRGRIEPGECFVALSEGELVGIIFCQIVSKEKINKGMYFYLLAVAKEWQGMGIASKLIQSVEKYASDRGCNYVVADTSKEAKVLLNWYLKKQKYVKYTLFKYENRNYYSVSFRKYLKKTIFALLWCRVHYFASVIWGKLR